MKFRLYDQSDSDAVVEIFRSNIPKYFSPAEEPGFREFLATRSREDYYVGDLDDKVIAAGGIALNDDETVSLCWGMVHANHLGAGLGRALTEFRIRIAREKFCGLPLVISTSQHTQGFYEKLGFRLTSHEPDGFGAGIDICKMRLEP